MKKEIKPNIQHEYHYYLLLALLLILPLIFSTSVENMFDAVKSTAFRILSSLFIIASIIFLWNKLKQNKLSVLINKQLDLAVLLIFAAAVISTIFSINHYVSIFGQYWRQIGLITYGILTLLYFFVSSSLSSGEKIDKILLTMEITAAITAIYSALQYFGLDPFDIQKVAFERPTSALGTSVFAAGFMTLILPFAVIRNFQKKVSLFSVIVPVIILVGIIISQTRTAYAGFIFELIIFCIFYPYLLKPDIGRFKRARKISYVILGSSLVVIIALNIFLPESIFIRRFQSIITISETQRWRLWETTLKMFYTYPITGTGISNYSRALEDFLTVALKKDGAFGYYDNAHNNFMHTLAVMGIIGLAAYLYMLYTGIKKSVLMVLRQQSRKNKNYFFLAMLCMFGGYIVYGFADFDEITIFTYFFILFAILKIELFSAGEGIIFKPELKTKNNFKNGFNIASAVIILFSIYNIYTAYTDIKADAIYSSGIKGYSNGNYGELNDKLNEALKLNPRAEYSFAGAYYNYLYCFNTSSIPENNRRAILQLAETQIKEAEKNYPSLSDCRSILSLIKFEQGDTIEGERIKNEVLTKDTLQTTFRVNLARYYFKHRNRDKAFEELKVVYKYDPGNVDAYITSIVYLIGNKEYKYAEDCCNTILRLDPGHPAALYYLDEIRRLKSLDR